MIEIPSKPLGRKNYGSIGHLPSSRMGPADHAMPEGQQNIATKKVRDKHDLVIVTEKLDGSNVGIANVNGSIYALGRSGYLAQTSKYEHHQLFAAWVRESRFPWEQILKPGQRLVGEWLALAHGTEYSLPLGPFAAFDLMVESTRAPYRDLLAICEAFGIPMPKLLHMGEAISVEQAMSLHDAGNHGLIGNPEGAVWRVERKGKFDFMGKWVSPDKTDGKFLPEISGAKAKWNWKP